MGGGEEGAGAAHRYIQVIGGVPVLGWDGAAISFHYRINTLIINKGERGIGRVEGKGPESQARTRSHGACGMR